MADKANSARHWTLIGLMIALLGVPAITLMYRVAVGETTRTTQLIAREVAIFALLGVVIWIVRRCERLPLSSIGLQRSSLGRSALWGLLLFLLLGAGTAVSLGLLQLLGLKYGGGHAFVPPVWMTAIIVLRAGVVEEVFYRGFAFERLNTLTGSRAVAAVVPLIAFALFHYNAGIAGVFIALILGSILTVFYIWRRDLQANMMGHFLIDFLPNVLLPLLGG